MRKFIWPLFAFTLLVIQSTSFVFYKGKLWFDLPLIFVYNLAMIRGSKDASIAGLSIGLIYDIVNTYIFGFYTFLYVIVLYF